MTRKSVQKEQPNPRFNADIADEPQMQVKRMLD